MHVRFRLLASLAVVFAASVVGRSISADVVIPSSAYSRGLGNAEFRSDVRVFNPTSSAIAYTPVLYDQRSGQTFTAPLQTIPPRAQQSFDNILGTLFGRTIDDASFGPIRFQTSGAIVVSSSVNNYNACGNGAVSGQWLPGLDASAALNAGTLVQLASSVDLGSGYRTNVVFTNPGTQPATVTAKVRKGDGTQISSATLDPLGANGFIQIGNWGSFPGVAGTADTNLWLEFTSDQPVLAFASVINNLSGDPFAIVMTAEPATGAGAPVASYTVSANPVTGQPVTFTDTSTNSPVNRFWVFGDGAVSVPGSSVVQHTYGAAGTYKSALLVDNASGPSSATSDVVVAAASATPIPVSIVATTSNFTHWTYNPNNVTLKVGQPYVITWTTPLAEATVHGMGGLEVLGIAGCDAISAQSPCARSFTPTAGMVGSHLYACTQTSCGTASEHLGMTATLTIAP
jgi:PKD repeat protein